jgi:nitroreductase
MDIALADRLLTTTRSVRKRLDLRRPVEPALIERAIEIALQAPTGSNSQGWHFVVVTDPAKRAGLAALYKRAFEAYASSPTRPAIPEGDPRAAQMPRILDSAVYLAEHLHEVPVHVIPCVEGRAEEKPNAWAASLYGSIIPAAWSFMLAARSRGLGTVWTTFHLIHEREAAEILGIPYEQVMQVALIPVAYTIGTEFKPGRRKPLDTMVHWNRW